MFIVFIVNYHLKISRIYRYIFKKNSCLMQRRGVEGGGGGKRAVYKHPKKNPKLPLSPQKTGSATVLSTPYMPNGIGTIADAKYIFSIPHLSLA